jgi:hypothetical protein
VLDIPVNATTPISGPSVTWAAPGHPDLPRHRADLARARRAERSGSSLLARLRSRAGVRPSEPRVA